MISGKEVFPLIEGGKGINGSDGRSSGAWAHENCVGTFSGVSPDYYDESGHVIFEKYFKKDRRERHAEMVEQSIRGSVAQAQIAHEVSGGNGRIHMNMLWELAGSEQILNGVLEKAKGLIHGVTCGAGLPYHLGELASKFGVYYYPIVSSARAFQVLWKRAYNKFVEFLGGVVYEDPWLAGGHNGFFLAAHRGRPVSAANALYAGGRAAQNDESARLAGQTDYSGRRRLVVERLGRLHRQSRNRQNCLSIRYTSDDYQRKPHQRRMEKADAPSEKRRRYFAKIQPDRLFLLGYQKHVFGKFDAPQTRRSGISLRAEQHVFSSAEHE